MLHFVTGRAGSGKTSFIQNRLSQLAKGGKGGMILIVPEQFSFESERSMLSLLGAKDALNIEILSFSRLAECVFAQVGGGCKKPVDDGGKIILMSLALEEVKDKLDFYSKYVQSTVLAKELLHICMEFKQCNISPQDLVIASKAMDDCTLKQKTCELAVVMSAYNALLYRSFTDESDVLDRLCDALNTHRYFEGRFVAIDSFKGFTAQEFEVIRKIICQADDVLISLSTDNIFGNNDIGLFSCVNQTARKLIYIAKENNIRISNDVKLPLENPVRFINDEINHLENNIFSPAFEVFEGRADNITLCCASSKTQECDFVAANAKRLMRTKGIRCKDMAVIARDAQEYRRELAVSFKKYGIPAFEDERQPITSQPLITLVRCAFEIASKGFSTDRLMRYLKTGLVGISGEDISVAENYALMWKIGAQGWKSEWTQHPDGFAIANEKSNQTLDHLNNIRKRAVFPLLKFSKACRDTNGEAISRAVFDLLCDIDAQENLKKLAVFYENNGNLALALEQERVWDMLMDILDKLASSVGNSSIEISRCSELFDSVLSVFDMGSIPQGLDEITIGSADRIRLSSPKVVFIVGANEGVFPKNPDGKGILNDSDRRRLIELGVEVSRPSEFKVSEERFIAYNSLCSTTDMLFVSYPRCSASGEALSPSEIVSQIEQIFPNCNKIFADELDTLDFIESEKSAFEACAKLYNEESEMSATLKKYIFESQVYTRKLLTLEKVTKKEPFRFENPQNAVALFGKNLFVSASQVENYHKCPFEYFCKYGLKAKPRKIAQLDPMESGTVIHFVLENIIKIHGSNALCEMSDAQIEREVHALLLEYLEKKMGGLDNNGKRFEYQYFRQCATICNVLERMKAEFCQSQFKPVDFELKIDHDGEIPPYSLKLQDEGLLKIIGSIDRVDLFEKDGKSYIRVVDYKSGKKEFALSDVYFGLNMQMLIYLFAVYKNGGELYGDIVPSGILYYPARMNLSRLSRHSSDTEIDESKIKENRCNGMLIDNLTVLNAMEKDLGGRFMPVKLKRGEPDGSLISFRQLLALKDKVDEILCKMASSLHEGSIPALPAFGKSYKNICDFCDYRSVCGAEEADEKREIEDLKHEDALKILNGGDDDE